MTRIYNWQLNEAPHLGVPDRVRKVDDTKRALLRKTHHGFDVVCRRCGSDAVGVGTDVFGSEALVVYLRCEQCELTTDIYDGP